MTLVSAWLWVCVRAATTTENFRIRDHLAHLHTYYQGVKGKHMLRKETIGTHTKNSPVFKDEELKSLLPTP